MKAKQVEFEIRNKDIAARIGRLKIGDRVIETPVLMPVYNPGKPLISPKELRDEFRCSALMTNAYMLLRNDGFRDKVLEEGIHRFMDFEGVIATDSGSYQLMAYGNVTATNSEIIRFQEEIGSDIGSFLDIPTLPDAYKPRAMEQLELTLKRAGEAEGAGFLVNAGIQGSTYMDLRERAAKEIGREFRLCAVGGIVRLMECYRFTELVEIISVIKQNIPTDRVVHAFGMGHPMVFSLAVALGCDLFDSAAYALYAEGLRYMTVTGTKRIDELDYLPCSCPVCTKFGLELKELPVREKIRELARHNLYVSFEEINRIKEAIAEDNLWEFLGMRCRAHPELFSALKKLTKQGWLPALDSITKKSAFYIQGPESVDRSEVVNVKSRLKRLDSVNKAEVPPFGLVPLEVLDIYPFNSIEDKPVNNVQDIDKIRGIMDYQFGSGAGELIGNVRIKRSRRTGRIRWVYSGKELIASIRASDHYVIPKKSLAVKLHERFKPPLLRVAVHDDAVPFILEGKSVFAGFVEEIDPDLRAGDEVLIVDGGDSLLRTGSLVLSPREALDFSRGVAVKVR
ncbi:MAG: tRNA guanosine(15) transglycosylase TgtA [Candidatus Altiarchaeota archaeon]|nr:tRNA guanosine(15) transglycosylase TgtA [Candidatus Altiarchaeota archaeon]